MVVIFFKTTETGSEEAARVSLRDGKLSGPEAYIRLLGQLDKDPEVSMRAAPKRVLGSYLQAALQE